jgi:hypothetical protein
MNAISQPVQELERRDLDDAVRPGPRGLSRASSPSPRPVYLLELKEPTMFITFKDLAGIASWGMVLTFLLVLLGFFPIAVLLGVGAIFIATLWVASQ